MAERNGDASSKGKFVESLAVKKAVDDNRILTDWLDSWPAVRAFVLGHEIQGQVLPAGTLSLGRSLRGIRVASRISLFDYEAIYEDEDWSQALERFDNDLDCNVVQWQPSYKERERLRRLAIYG